MMERKHKDFILTPITSILEEAVFATQGLDKSIVNYSLLDYIMQSIFLRMTGFQEQKMKSILWELATDDYDFRRKYIENDLKLGACSEYKAKEKIFENFIKIIENNFSEKQKKDFHDDLNELLNPKVKGNGNGIFNDCYDELINIISNSRLREYNERDFNEFSSLIASKKIKNEDFMHNDNNKKFTLFRNELVNIYVEFLYKKRNKLAHNTISYQQNLPDLRELSSEKYKYENYFLYFFILILIDRIFIELYKKYLEIL